MVLIEALHRSPFASAASNVNIKVVFHARLRRMLSLTNEHGALRVHASLRGLSRRWIVRSARRVTFASTLLATRSSLRLLSSLVALSDTRRIGGDPFGAVRITIARDLPTPP